MTSLDPLHGKRVVVLGFARQGQAIGVREVRQAVPPNPLDGGATGQIKELLVEQTG